MKARKVLFAVFVAVGLMGLSAADLMEDRASDGRVATKPVSMAMASKAGMEQKMKALEKTDEALKKEVAKIPILEREHQELQTAVSKLSKIDQQGRHTNPVASKKSATTDQQGQAGKDRAAVRSWLNKKTKKKLVRNAVELYDTREEKKDAKSRLTRQLKIAMLRKRNINRKARKVCEKGYPDMYSNCAADTGFLQTTWPKLKEDSREATGEFKKRTKELFGTDTKALNKKDLSEYTVLEKKFCTSRRNLLCKFKSRGKRGWRIRLAGRRAVQKSKCIQNLALAGSKIIVGDLTDLGGAVPPGNARGIFMGFNIKNFNYDTFITNCEGSRPGDEICRIIRRGLAMRRGRRCIPVNKAFPVKFRLSDGFNDDSMSACVQIFSDTTGRYRYKISLADECKKISSRRRKLLQDDTGSSGC